MRDPKRKWVIWRVISISCLDMRNTTRGSEMSMHNFRKQCTSIYNYKKQGCTLDTTRHSLSSALSLHMWTSQIQTKYERIWVSAKDKALLNLSDSDHKVHRTTVINAILCRNHWTLKLINLSKDKREAMIRASLWWVKQKWIWSMRTLNINAHCMDRLQTHFM